MVQSTPEVVNSTTNLFMGMSTSSGSISTNKPESSNLSTQSGQQIPVTIEKPVVSQANSNNYYSNNSNTTPATNNNVNVNVNNNTNTNTIPSSPATIGATPTTTIKKTPVAPVISNNAEVCDHIKILAAEVVGSFEKSASEQSKLQIQLIDKIQSLKLSLDREEINGRRLQKLVEETEAEQARFAETEDFESADALSIKVITSHLFISYLICYLIYLFLLLFLFFANINLQLETLRNDVIESSKEVISQNYVKINLYYLIQL